MGIYPVGVSGLTEQQRYWTTPDEWETVDCISLFLTLTHSNIGQDTMRAPRPLVYPTRNLPGKYPGCAMQCGRSPEELPFAPD